MKKILALILSITVIFGLAACGKTTPEPTQESPSPAVTVEPENSETAESTAPESGSTETEGENSEEEVLESNVADMESDEAGEEVPEDGRTLIAYFSHTGNTEEIAVEINSLVGGDLVEIVEADPYPTSYQECVDRAEQEKNEGIRPETTTVIENMETYDTIYIGYPIWWHDTPMIIYTFLESYDLSGKTVIPFCTSGGSDIEESMPTINNLCSESTVLDGLTADGPEDVEGWLSGIGMLN